MERNYFSIFVSIGARAVTELLKYLIHADRPFIKLQNVSSLFPETGYSFPSGHATFYGFSFCHLFFHKKLATSLCFALLIGLVRIVGGVHFPIDILGGFIVGFLTSYIVFRIFVLFTKYPKIVGNREIKIILKIIGVRSFPR